MQRLTALGNSLGNFYRTHQSAFTTFVLLAAERVLQMFIGLWIASQIARNFDQATFAHWQIAMSLWFVFGNISGITGERVILPSIYATKPKDFPTLWNTAIAAKLISGLLAALPLMLWASTMPDPQILALCVLWSLQLMISQVVSMGIHEAYARDDFRGPQIARITGMTCRLLVATLLLWFDAPVTWLVWGWIIEICVMSLFLCQHWISGRFLKPRLVDWAMMRRMFAQGAALTVASVASVALTRVDRIALGKNMPTEVLSQYAAAMTLLEAAFAFATMLATIFGAKVLFRPGAINPRHHAGIAAFAAGIALIVTLALYVVAEPLMTTIYGAAYLQSAHYLRIAVGLLPLVFLQSILQAPLIARASKRFHLIKATTAFVVGAAIASIAAHLEQYDWISAGAYGGYLVLILFDLGQLLRRAKDIYGTGTTDGAPSPTAEPHRENA